MQSMIGTSVGMAMSAPSLSVVATGRERSDGAEVHPAAACLEDLRGHERAELFGVPRLAFGTDLPTLLPSLHPDDAVVGAADHLAGHVVGFVARQPGHPRRAVLRVHRVPLARGNLGGLEGVTGSRHRR